MLNRDCRGFSTPLLFPAKKFAFLSGGRALSMTMIIQYLRSTNLSFTPFLSNKSTVLPFYRLLAHIGGARPEYISLILNKGISCVPRSVVSRPL